MSSFEEFAVEQGWIIEGEEFADVVALVKAYSERDKELGSLEAFLREMGEPDDGGTTFIAFATRIAMFQKRWLRDYYATYFSKLNENDQWQVAYAYFAIDKKLIPG